MTLTLELPPELEQRVREAAERGGFATTQDYIFDLLEQATPSKSGARRRARSRSRRKAAIEAQAEEEAAIGALLPGEGEIPPPIPLAQIRGVRHDVQLVREMRGGYPYDYYPLGEYIVAAPGVCGGRLTFKYRRLDARWVLAALERGKSESYVAEGYGLDPAAIRELLELAVQNEREIFERTVIGPAADR